MRPYDPEDLNPAPDFDPPDSPTGGGWSAIANIAGDVTPWKTTNFASKLGSILDFNGTFPVITVTTDTIILGDPGDTNAAWADLSGETAYFSPRLATSGLRWVGPFTVDLTDCESIICNFFCPQGLWKFDEEGNPQSKSVSGRLEVTPVNADGSARGAVQNFDVTLKNAPEGKVWMGVADSFGDDGEIDRSPRGKTLEAALNEATKGLVTVRFRRTTAQPDYDDGVQYMDDLSIRDCYGIGPITVDHYGDVTTVQTRIQATSQSTASKERKMQCVVTRKVLQRNVDDTFGPTLVPSQNAADILCHMALDPHIGGRTVDELDVPQIYATAAEAQAYFGFDEVFYFNHTFDDDGISFEESAQALAQAVFCIAYRQGSKLRLHLERSTDDATLLFTHRNKLPGSETRTIRFGLVDENDGVEFDYRLEDGQQRTIFLPADESALRPKKIERIGVTDPRQAQIHADRIWQRMQYQHTTTEFEATGEASQLVLNERIEVADNTRPDTFDGHVEAQDGLTLTLSQPWTPQVGLDYVIFIQLPSGGLDVIPIIAGASEFEVVLQSPLSEAIDLSPELWADVVYQIVSDAPARLSAFLVAEKGAFDKRSVRVTAINYDPRYYAHDQDHAD